MELLIVAFVSLILGIFIGYSYKATRPDIRVSVGIEGRDYVISPVDGKTRITDPKQIALHHQWIAQGGEGKDYGFS